MDADGMRSIFMKIASYAFQGFVYVFDSLFIDIGQGEFSLWSFVLAVALLGVFIRVFLVKPR